jgi:predicted Holliday junction resolvase-like endonuclease
MLDSLISDNILIIIILISLCLIVSYIFYMLHMSISNLFSKVESMESKMRHLERKNIVETAEKEMPKQEMPKQEMPKQEIPEEEETDLDDITEENVIEDITDQLDKKKKTK